MNSKKQKPIPLTPGDNSHTLAIKCYEEQCVNGMEATLKKVRELDCLETECYSILHDKGAKPHLHICMRYMDGTKRVACMLKLLGIEFRDEDMALMVNHGLETVGSFVGYFVYLTHKDDASRKAGKVIYESTAFITNMTPARFSSVLKNKIPKRKMTKAEIHRQDCIDAKEAGYSGITYDEWFASKEIEFIGKPETKRKEIIRFFEAGQNQRLNEYIPHIVICLNIPVPPFIYNNKDVKTVAARALSELYRSYNEETGAYPLGKPILGEVTVARNLVQRDGIEFPEARREFKKFKMQYYDDNNSPRIANGKIEGGWIYKVIITRDADIDNAYHDDPDKSYYYCTLSADGKELLCKDVCRRGSLEEQEDRKRLYIKFRDVFNKYLADYVPIETEQNKAAVPTTIDYSDILS